MKRRPPRSTRTDTLFPSTTLFRSRQELARKASELTGVEAREIFDVLLERERLGTTGVGHGIAIPHGKLAKLDRLYGVFARMENPIDFDSIDDEPVDLLFLLLAPESRSEERRVGTECVSPCRSSWSPDP